jgi:hypothetical protein
MYGLVLATSTAASLFNYYPGFTDPNTRIEAVIDKGLIAELVIRCDVGTGIIAASLIEHTYCTPNFQCYASLEKAIAKTCGE